MEWIRRVFRFFNYRTYFPKKGSISWLIKRAKPGETIYIPAGEYTESIQMKKGVNLSGLD